MSFAVLLGLFLLKHGVLAHVVDFGYSISRSSGHRHWYLGLYCHVLAEAAGTLFLLVQFTWHEAALALTIEHVALVISGLVERRAPLRKLFQTHIACETVVLVVYGLIAALMVYGP